MEIGVRFGQKDVVAVGWEKVLKKLGKSDFGLPIDAKKSLMNFTSILALEGIQEWPVTPK